MEIGSSHTHTYFAWCFICFRFSFHSFNEWKLNEEKLLNYVHQTNKQTNKQWWLKLNIFFLLKFSPWMVIIIVIIKMIIRCRKKWPNFVNKILLNGLTKFGQQQRTKNKIFKKKWFNFVCVGMWVDGWMADVKRIMEQKTNGNTSFFHIIVNDDEWKQKKFFDSNFFY